MGRLLAGHDVQFWFLEARRAAFPRCGSIFGDSSAGIYPQVTWETQYGAPQCWCPNGAQAGSRRHAGVNWLSITLCLPSDPSMLAFPDQLQRAQQVR